jgi:hypothetical protein
MAVHLSESIDDFGELVLVADILDNAGGIASFFSKESSATQATQTRTYDPIGICLTFSPPESYLSLSLQNLVLQWQLRHALMTDPIGILFDFFATGIPARNF